MTFGLSFGLTLITIAWVASLLRLGDGSRALLLGAFTIACSLETVLVSLQAWRGVPSHFNIETTFDALVARTLAAGGVVLVAVIGTLTFAVFRANATVPVSLRTAMRIGLVALFISVVVGAFMIAKGMRLLFAGYPQAAYATGGTLKPTHAATMHAILVLPVLARLLSFVDWTERRRLAVVLLLYPARGGLRGGEPCWHDSLGNAASCGRAFSVRRARTARGWTANPRRPGAHVYCTVSSTISHRAVAEALAHLRAINRGASAGSTLTDLTAVTIAAARRVPAPRTPPNALASGLHDECRGVVTKRRWAVRFISPPSTQRPDLGYASRDFGRQRPCTRSDWT
jgi:hypothetical protein